MRSINYIILLSCILFTSCKKDKKEEGPSTPVATFQDGLLVLNEGLFQQNNSSLSWIQFGTDAVNNSIFEQKANRQLGDTGNDIQRYGNKIYVVVNVSSTIEIMDAITGNSLSQIIMTNNGVPKQPRSIAFFGNKGYVTCYDGFVDVIDTATFQVEQRIAVGANPENIVLASNKLFVTNSGGLNYPNVDSTVSVIDPISNSEIQKITIGNNPGGIVTDGQGNVYAIARGNYGSIPSRMVQINALTNTISTNYPFDCSSVSVMNNKLILHSSVTGNETVKLFNPATNLFENSNFIDITLFTTLYNIQFDAARNQLYCFDAMNYTNSGYVRIFTSSGSYIKSINVGLNPSKALIY